jgi:hypothetical protein
VNKDFKGRLKLKKLFFSIFIFLFAMFAFGQTSGFGLGIIVGEPTGFSGKLWISGTSAFDAAIGWSFVDTSTQANQSFNAQKPLLQFHLDYLFHIQDPFKVPAGRFFAYLGAGGRIEILNPGVSVGIRIPFGLLYFPPGVPLDIFLEIVPVMEVIPATVFTGNGGLGVRWFF